MAGNDLATLRVNVVASTRDFSRGMGRVRKESRSVLDRFRNLRWEALAVTSAIAGVGFGVKKIFDVGAAVEETASKYRTVFGPAVAETNKMLGRQARVMGLTDRQARELLATTGAMVQGMGFAQAASAAYAAEVVKLGGDLASFNNIPIEETTRAIQAAITGERESLKRLGIVILESDVQQRAMAMSGVANAKALTQQQKAAATLALVAEKAGVAVGDLERTQSSAANTARRIWAVFRQVADNIATGLLPTMSLILGITDDNTSSAEEWGEAFARSGGEIAAWANVALTAVRAVAVGFSNLIQLLFLSGALIVEVMRNNWTMSVEQMRNHIAPILQEMQNLVVGIGQAFRDVPAAVKAATEGTAKGLEGGIFGQDGLVLNIADVSIEKLGDLEMAVQGLAHSFTDTLGNALVDGELRFKEFVKSAIADLAALAARFAIFQLLGGGAAGTATGVGGILAGLFSFGGGKAAGGPVQGGTAYVVGEKGPETFVPDQSGTIVPNGGSMFDFSRFPAASNPLAMARDSQWIRFLTESSENAKASGYSFAGANG